MDSATATTGATGERVAASLLRRHGCTIVERNALVDVDEIDLVIAHRGCLVAVEVKTATNGDDPVDAVDDAKFARLVRAADGYHKPIGRIDLIGIDASGAAVVVRWLQGVR